MNAIAKPHSYDDFVERLSRLIGQGDGRPVSMILADIDWFGRMNASRGRDAGDAAIGELTAFLSANSPDTAQVYRYGGDAFMVLLPGTEKEQAFLVAEALRGGFESESGKSARAGADAPLTISCGVAACPDDGVTVPVVIRKVSEALYRAKLNGRNRVALAREEKMVTKTVHYTQGQLEGLSRLAKREGLNEATLLREALDDLLRKHNS
jgi:diguanylate cyclase (GGDEF)-like protein